MIYTVTSTLPKQHGGRTKSLLSRVNFMKERMGIDQTILTTNYHANYPSIYKSFYNRGILNPDIKIVNIYDWLSGYNLYTIPKNIFGKKKMKNNKVKLENVYKKENKEKGIERYYDKDTDAYVRYREFYLDSDIPKFDDKMVSYSKTKVKRWEYNEYGYLHKVTNYFANSRSKKEEYLYDVYENLYCRRTFNKDKNNTISSIGIYEKGEVIKEFHDEKDFFTYFFNLYFEDRDIVFNDARLLDKSLTECARLIKPIFVFHSSHLNGEKIKGSFKLALERSDKVAKYLVLTNQQKEEIKKKTNIPDEKFAVIPHFIQPATNNSFERKDQFVYLGRFSHEKRIDHIVKAFKLFKDKGYSTKLVLYGATNDKERMEIEALIKENKLEDEVTIYKFTNDPASVFRESKASILTSKFEGYALTVMESINEGCPSIAYDIRYGPKEIINDGKNGLLVEAGNIEDLSNKMEEIISSPLENVKLKESNYPEAAKNNYLELLEKVKSL